jgi:hypothetical protein
VIAILLNIGLGVIPTLALAWSVAADERKSVEDRIVRTERDRREHNIVFSLVYGLWGLTLAMWNWMRGESVVWIALWLTLGVIGLVMWRLLSARRKRTT